MNPPAADDQSGSTRLATLLQEFQRAAAATTADRARRDQLLDKLQEAVGLAGRMTTEAAIVRRATALLQQS